MVLAQALGEYGMMAGLAAAMRSSYTRAQIVLRDLDGQDYLIIAAVVLVVLRLVSRRG